MQEPFDSCTVVQSPKNKFGYELSLNWYLAQVMGERSAQSSDGADRCPEGRYRVPRSIYSVTIFTETRIIYSVADIRVPARNPRIPHAHRGLLSQKYHCSSPLSSPAADAVYRSVRQHGRYLDQQNCEVMAPGPGGSPFQARWDATAVSLYSVVKEPWGSFTPSPCIPHFFRV